jgi:hypothetical protein
MTRAEQQQIYNTHKLWLRFDEQSKFRIYLKNKRLVKLLLALAIRDKKGLSNKVSELLESKLSQDTIYEAFLNNPDMDIEVQPAIKIISAAS